MAYVRRVRDGRTAPLVWRQPRRAATRQRREVPKPSETAEKVVVTGPGSGSRRGSAASGWRWKAGRGSAGVWLGFDRPFVGCLLALSGAVVRWFGLVVRFRLGAG